MENPDLLMELSPDDLERISKQYPYFSVAQVLLSKSYQRRKDHRFADQVAQASLYAGNREKLYHYLKEESTVIETPVVALPRVEAKTTETATEATTPLPLPVIVPVSEPQAPEEKPSQDFSGLVDFILDEKGIVPDKEEIQPEPTNLVAERVEIAFHVDEPLPVPATRVTPAEEPKAALPERVPVPEMDDFQREILLEAIQSSIEQEVSTEETEADAEPQITQQTPPAEDDQSFAAWVYRRSQQVHFAENAQKQPVDQTESPDVADWKHLSDEETRAASGEAEMSADPEVDELLSRDETTTLSHRSTKIQSTDYESHKRDLIDRFIRQEPRITRGKTTDYTPGNIAKDSVEEDHLPVTETMAQLYARQGRLDKARKAFKKLIELHPEKSVYFAAQLKNLDKFKKP